MEFYHVVKDIFFGIIIGFLIYLIIVSLLEVPKFNYNKDEIDLSNKKKLRKPRITKEEIEREHKCRLNNHW